MNTSKKLTISFFIGMIAISVASLSFSIAWYATSSFLTVAPIDIEIETDRHLKISTTNEEGSFKETLSKENNDLVDCGAFAPVSSIFSKRWTSLHAQAPKFYDCTRVWSGHDEPVPEEVERNHFYYSEDFYIYSDTDVYITIDADNTYIDANEEFNNKYASVIQKDHPEYSKKEIVGKLNDLVKSMRFSILIPDEEIYHYYVIDPNKAENDEPVLFGGVLDNTKEKKYDTHVKDGVRYETVYGDVENRDKIEWTPVLENDIGYEGEYSAFNSIHKTGTRAFFLEDQPEEVKIAEEESISLEQIKNDPNTYFKIPVDKGYEHTRKMVISIYIEGWDRHSINSTMGSHFKSNLSFKILTPKKPS